MYHVRKNMHVSVFGEERYTIQKIKTSMVGCRLSNPVPDGLHWDPVQNIWDGVTQSSFGATRVEGMQLCVCVCVWGGGGGGLGGVFARVIA